MPSTRNFDRKLLSEISACAALIVLLFLATPEPASAEPGQFLAAGRKAPVLTLERLSGGELTFPAQGRWTIVFFWSLFCHVCIEELPILAEEVAALPKDSVQAVFISIDTARMKKGLENFLKKRHLDICVTLDRVIASASYEAADAWGVRPTPAAFLVNPEGIVTYSCEGPFEPRNLFDPLRNALGVNAVCSAAADTATAACAVPAPAQEPLTVTAPASFASEHGQLPASSAVQP